MNVILFGILFLVFEVAIIGLLIAKMIKKRKLIEKSDIIYIAPIFILSWVMYAFALFYYNLNIEQTSTSFISILSLAKTTLETFVFAFDISLLEPIMNSSAIMMISYSLMLVLASLTTVLTIVFVGKNIIKNMLKKNKALKNNGDIILGLSESALKYNKLNPSSIVWDDTIKNSEYKDLINKGYVINSERLSKKILYSKLKKGSHHLILFKDSNYSYSDILNLFENIVVLKNNKINKKFKNNKQKIIKNLKKDNLSDLEIEKILKEKYQKIKSDNLIYLHIESKSEEMEAIKEEFASFAGTDINSFVTCFNKFENIAMDFVKNYPISYNLPRDFYNENYSLKKDKKVNVVFVGFGNVNSQLFKMMNIDFQFAKEKSSKSKLSKFESEQVNYYVYENDECKFSNDNFSKLQYEFDNLKNNKIDKMEKICNLKYDNLNVYSSEIKKNLQEIITENSYTYIIVSFGSDLENIAYAENLQNYLAEKSNFKIFTRVSEDVFYDKPNANRGITYFGKENELYSRNAITNINLIQLAQETKSAHAKKTNNEDYYKWNNLILMHQYSKLYLTLSMFFKVGLMGYKLVSKKELSKLKNVEILGFETFEKNFSHLPLEEMKKDYSLFFGKTASNLMAYICHLQWNAHYYLSGYKPMDVDKFQPDENGQIKPLKTHGTNKQHSSLTSYDGLDKLFRYIYLMKKYGNDYDKHDISEITQEELNSEEFNKIEQYSYDFRILDFLKDLLNKDYFLIK